MDRGIIKASFSKVIWIVENKWTLKIDKYKYDKE